jgi:SH3 domain protein
MKFLSIFIILLLLITFLLPTVVMADTRYVDDQLVITLRQGKSSRHKILRTLKTGTPLEVLEEDEAYLKVRTTDGLEGFVLKQYITSSTPKALIITRLGKENKTLQDKVTRLGKTNDDLKAQIGSMQEIHTQKILELTGKSSLTEEALQQIKKEQEAIAENYSTLLAQSKNVIAIAEERDQLLKDKSKLTSAVTSLRNQNEKLSDNRMIKWFLAGGGVLFFGWILGKISRKKKSRY